MFTQIPAVNSLVADVYARLQPLALTDRYLVRKNGTDAGLCPVVRDETRLTDFLSGRERA